MLFIPVLFALLEKEIYAFLPSSALKSNSNVDLKNDLILPLAFSRTMQLPQQVPFSIFRLRTSLHESKEDPEKSALDNLPSTVAKPNPPAILPFDPRYSTEGPVSEGDFVISREGEPTKEELSNENLYKILHEQCTDLEVNTLVWKGLGYRFNAETKTWENDKVFPKWKEKFPEPPDLIGMQRIYSKEVDQPSLKSNQQLVKSIPQDNKQSLKEHLKPLGFTGFKISQLTPNKTRRAQCANWLLFFREELFGYTVEELRARRAAKRAKAEQEEIERKEKLKAEGKDEDDGKDGWKYPLKEVY